MVAITYKAFVFAGIVIPTPNVNAIMKMLSSANSPKLIIVQVTMKQHGDIIEARMLSLSTRKLHASMRNEETPLAKPTKAILSLG